MSRSSVLMTAPAKVNLGLEILGRRADGFHEIRSILARVSLADELRFSLGAKPGSVRFFGRPDPIDPVDNLVSRSIAAFNRAAATSIWPDVEVHKRIPAAAGLGGASSDAATTLRAMQSLAPTKLSDAALCEVAAFLGSDVPFFLGSPTAMVSGRGTDLEPLPVSTGYLIIVMPDISIEGKTAHLYRALNPDDFTDGSEVTTLAFEIRQGAPLAGPFPNTFDVVFRRTDPRMNAFAQRIHCANVGASVLSGAGPARFLLYETREARDQAIETMRACLAPSDELFPCEFEGTGR